MEVLRIALYEHKLLAGLSFLYRQPLYEGILVVFGSEKGSGYRLLVSFSGVKLFGYFLTTVYTLHSLMLTINVCKNKNYNMTYLQTGSQTRTDAWMDGRTD